MFMIRCENIGKTYQMGEDNELAVLTGINFEISQGEYIAIIGPSGSGKSTLMNILGALDRPSVGKYFLDGQDVSSLSDGVLAEIRCKKIGFVFQSFNLLSRSIVRRNVMVPLIYAKTPKELRAEKVANALNAAGLEENRWDHLSNQLSGGQMQRVAIARALINNPEIILADEPTGNLDSKTGEIVLDAFRRLNKEFGHTIILITHEHEVAAHTDRIIELRDGRLVSDKKIK